MNQWRHTLSFFTRPVTNTSFVFFCPSNYLLLSASCHSIANHPSCLYYDLYVHSDVLASFSAQFLVVCCEHPPVSIPNFIGWGGRPPFIPAECLEATTQLRGPAHSSIPWKALLTPKPTQDKSSSKLVKNSPQFHVWRRVEGECLCMFQHVKRSCKSEGKHRLGLYMPHVWEIQERGSEDCVSQVKRMHQCVGNGRKFVKTLLVLGQCYGADVHYLNSSKHRKLIELRWNDFNSWNVMRTSCSCRNNNGYGCDADSTQCSLKAKCNPSVSEWGLLCAATQ